MGMKSVIALLCIGSISLIGGCFYRLDLDDDLDEDDDEDWNDAVLMVNRWEDWTAGTTVGVVQPFSAPSLGAVSVSLGLDDSGMFDAATIDGVRRAALNTLTRGSGSNCVTRNVSGQVIGQERELDVEVRGYLRCGSACPLAGVVVLRDGGNRVSVTFDGRDQARLERSGGSVELAELDCQRR
jgi:hypothetical protein